MPTAIPPTELSQILQTKSSPETIAALLNEAEAMYSSTPRHFNAKRVYPFWKICQACSNPYQCHTREQVQRNKTCSRDCASVLLRAPRARKPPQERAGMVELTCATCGTTFWRNQAWAKRVTTPFCSHRCNGIQRGKEWATHAYKGRAAWTDASRASYREKMTGENNPAWRGGVTYFRKHGNYKPIKYVRCPLEYQLMARKDGYVMEHRLIVAQAIGRPLLRSEVVHHKNHDPNDNRLENLQLFASNRDHKLYEHHGTPAPIWPE